MASDKRSLMERMLSGEVVIDFGRVEHGYSHDYAVSLTKDEVWVRGCDCSAPMSEAEVAEIYEALGTYLRIRRNKDRKRGTGERA
jgi:hypothetical protein